jgi:hypothetical protein
VAKIHLHQGFSEYVLVYDYLVGVELFSKDGTSILAEGTLNFPFKEILIGEEEKLVGFKALTWPKKHL